MQGQALNATSTQEIFVKHNKRNPLNLLSQVMMYVFRTLTGAYGMSVTGFLILRLLISEEQLWLIALFNSFVHLLILPALILLPIVLLMRRWELAALTVAPALAFSIWYGGMWVNSAPNVSEDMPRFSMVTFNMASYGSQLEEFTGLIREMDADVVLLQELSEPAAQAFAESLENEYPYQVTATNPQNPVMGQGVLSRFPILEDEAYIPYGYYQQRLLLEIHGREIAMYNVHLVYPFLNKFERRRQDVAELLARMDAETVPVVVGGDFNLTERNVDYIMMTDTYRDAFRIAGRGMGWTYTPFGHVCVEGIPVCALGRIDYVFHDSGFIATDARVWERSNGSDHYPVRVELAIQDYASYPMESGSS